MNKLLFCTLLCLTQASYAAIYQMELEHSYAELEGSSWGIEGQLKEKLNTSVENLPAIFKIPLKNLAPATYTFKDKSEAPLYINGTIFLYQKINICIDSRINHKNAGFDFALDNFLSKIAQVSNQSRPIDLRFSEFDFVNFNEKRAFDCDAFAFIGEKDQFPFSQVQDSPAPHFSKIPQMLLGMYFRLSKSTIPVIVLNPSLLLDFNSAQNGYLRLSESNEVTVDARTLFFHELGHLFGLAHVRDGGSWKPFSSLTVMGVDSSQSEKKDSDFRFRVYFDIWRNWDAQQTSIYRTIFSRWIDSGASDSELKGFKLDRPQSGYCVLPGENLNIPFTPMQIPNSFMGDGLQEGSELFDLSRISPEVFADGEALKTRYSISSKQSLLIAEFHKKLKAPFFTAEQFARAVTPQDGPFPAEWLLLSLNGKISSQAEGIFHLSGHFALTSHLRSSFPGIEISVEKEQRNCYKKR